MCFVVVFNWILNSIFVFHFSLIPLLFGLISIYFALLVGRGEIKYFKVLILLTVISSLSLILSCMAYFIHYPYLIILSIILMSIGCLIPVIFITYIVYEFLNHNVFYGNFQLCISIVVILLVVLFLCIKLLFKFE